MIRGLAVGIVLGAMLLPRPMASSPRSAMIGLRERMLTPRVLVWPTAQAPEPSAVPVRVLVSSYCQTGLTATGTWTGPGTIAVDPSFIPFGSQLRVPGWGSGVAVDSGSAVLGAHIDMYDASCAQALAWGVRYETVEVAVE